ncbi:MAG: hypothetical protein QOF73_2018, partial [Thermomicrobiales bacterium]|nr:hypothetical protein [Thermomicrobiales bacterium]
LRGPADLARPQQTQSQRLGEAAHVAGFEGLLVPSCTQFASGNLVVFLDNLRPGALLAIVGSEDPNLFVAR